MARVLSIKLLENCLDNSQVKEFTLDTPLTEEIMRWMAQEARLLFYSDFPRPYFRIEKERAYVIQGILGNDHFRVTFMPSAPSDQDQSLKYMIEEQPASHPSS